MDQISDQIVGLRLDEQAAKEAASEWREKTHNQRIKPSDWVQMPDHTRDHAAKELGYVAWHTDGEPYMGIEPYVVPPLS